MRCAQVSGRVTRLSACSTSQNARRQSTCAGDASSRPSPEKSRGFHTHGGGSSSRLRRMWHQHKCPAASGHTQSCPQRCAGRIAAQHTWRLQHHPFRLPCSKHDVSEAPYAPVPLQPHRATQVNQLLLLPQPIRAVAGLRLTTQQGWAVGRHAAQRTTELPGQQVLAVLCRCWLCCDCYRRPVGTSTLAMHPPTATRTPTHLADWADG